MLSIPHYVILWCILFTILGAVWYNLDRRWGARLYRRWYDLTHEYPLPAGETRGFVYNRGNKSRFLAAAAVSTVQSLAVVLTTPVNPMVEFAMWIFEIPVTMVGFYLGPYVGRLWDRSDRVFAVLDRLERRVERRGETQDSPVSGPGSEAAAETEAPGPVARSSDDTDSSEPHPAAESTRQPDEDGAPEAVDPRDLVRSYARKRS